MKIIRTIITIIRDIAESITTNGYGVSAVDKGKS
tara:strand:- start:2861 stop:2962 length:102 start_codon:yes stop_codon:yes gene_type:complete